MNNAAGLASLWVTRMVSSRSASRAVRRFVNRFGVHPTCSASATQLSCSFRRWVASASYNSPRSQCSRLSPKLGSEVGPAQFMLSPPGVQGIDHRAVVEYRQSAFETVGGDQGRLRA